MGGDDERCATSPSRRLKEIQGCGRCLVVQAGCGFVGQHHPRRHQNGARQRDTLRLSTRDLSGSAPCQIGHAQARQGGLNRQRVDRPPQREVGQGEVLADGEGVDQVQPLRQKTHLAAAPCIALAGSQPLQGLTRHRDLARRWGEQPTRQRQPGRLARARGAEHQQPTALRHVDIGKDQTRPARQVAA